MLNARFIAGLLALALATTPPMITRPALAASAAEINRDANAVLAKLYQSKPDAKKLAAQAKAILIFPTIYKAGFMFGAQYGEGVLRRGNKSVGYYNTVAASYGWQAGAQAFGYALFFMNESALSYLDKSERLRGRSGAEHRRARRGHGKGHDDLDRDARHLRDHLRPDGADGGSRRAGIEDQQDRQVIRRSSPVRVGRARPR